MDDVYDGWAGLGHRHHQHRPVAPRPAARLRQPGGYHRFDWVAERYAEWHVVPPGGLLVLEGVGVRGPPGRRARLGPGVGRAPAGRAHGPLARARPGRGRPVHRRPGRHRSRRTSAIDGTRQRADVPGRQQAGRTTAEPAGQTAAARSGRRGCRSAGSPGHRPPRAGPSAAGSGHAAPSPAPRTSPPGPAATPSVTPGRA